MTEVLDGVTVGSVGRALVWLSVFRRTRVVILARACATFAPRPQATEGGSIHLSRKSKDTPLNWVSATSLKKKPTKNRNI